MFTPAKMCKVNILVLQKHLNSITSSLGDSGMVHLVNAVDQSQDNLLNAIDIKQNTAALQNMLNRCRLLIDALGIESDARVPDIGELEREEIDALLTRVYERYQEQDQVIAKLLQETDSISQENLRLTEFPLQNIRLAALRNLSHFYMVTGKMHMDAFLRARQVLDGQALFVRSEDNSGKVLVLSSRRNRWMVEEDLQKLGFVKLEAPEDVQGEVAEKRHELEDEIDVLRSKLNAARLAVLRLGERYGGLLLAIKRQLNSYLAVQQAQGMFGRLNHLCCVTGWVPKENLEDLRKIVSRATDGVGIVEAIDANDDALVKAGLDSVPVKFSSNALERPFQMLVTNFAIPNYHELDPSFFVGLTFVIMFGYMFGDVGQGAVLGLLGLYLRFSRRNFKLALRDTGTLLSLCGLSAVFFGFCYGSFFGYENHEFFEPLWLGPMQQRDIPQLLLTAVGMGVVFISIAVLINVLNHFLARRYFEGTFDKFGLLGICFYWGMLGVGINVAITRSLALWQLLFVAVPLLLLFLKEPLHNLFHHHNPFYQSSFLNVVLEGGIELMETMTGYLSGTVSFVRVGAFAISHAALCLAVFAIVGMLKEQTLGGVMSIIVAVLGNLLIIVFEGMVAAIQCVRLEYYELFSRFFQGGGVAYQPFRIKEEEKEK
jgi:V/A-type H+-transporting ATPase subunit I